MAVANPSATNSTQMNTRRSIRSKKSGHAWFSMGISIAVRALA
jgi:hypothetical protein